LIQGNSGANGGANGVGAANPSGLAGGLAAGAAVAGVAAFGIYRLYKRKKEDMSPFDILVDNTMLENPVFPETFENIGDPL